MCVYGSSLLGAALGEATLAGKGEGERLFQRLGMQHGREGTAAVGVVLVRRGQLA